jgi:hypothetical protein
MVDIEFKSKVRSKPPRENFETHDNAIEKLATEIDDLLASGGYSDSAEVIQAREGETSLVENLRNIKDSLATYQYQVFGGSSLKVSESSPAAMTVDVASGSAIVNGVGVSYAGGTSGTISAAAAGKHRYDSVVINSAGSVAVKTGSEVDTTDSRPRPTILTSEKEIAYIDIDESTTSITDSLITDTRQIYARGIPFVTVGDFGMFDTIQKAIDYIVDTQSGDGIIHIASGTYTETFDYSGVSRIVYVLSGDVTINSGNYRGQLTVTSIGLGGSEEGDGTTASGAISHAEGLDTTASGISSHAEGSNTTASSSHSHAGGLYTIADQSSMTAIGKYNTGGSGKIFEVGIGTGTGSRDDGLTLYDDGDFSVKGDITTESGKINPTSKFLTGTYTATTPTENEVFDALKGVVPNVGDGRLCTGAYDDGATNEALSYFERASSTVINIYYGTGSVETVTDGTATTINDIRVAW